MRVLIASLVLTLGLVTSSAAQQQFVARLYPSEVVPPVQSKAYGEVSITGSCSPQDSSAVFFTARQIGLGHIVEAVLVEAQPGFPYSALRTVIDGHFWFTSGLLTLSPRECALLSDGRLGFVITTSHFPLGEVRGQFEAVVPTIEDSWGTSNGGTVNSNQLFGFAAARIELWGSGLDSTPPFLSTRLPLRSLPALRSHWYRLAGACIASLLLCACGGTTFMRGSGRSAYVPFTMVKIQPPGSGTLSHFEEDFELMLFMYADSVAVQRKKPGPVAIIGMPNEGWIFDRWTGDVQDSTSRETNVLVKYQGEATCFFKRDTRAGK